jgi:hypothetical protein
MDLLIGEFKEEYNKARTTNTLSVALLYKIYVKAKETSKNVGNTLSFSKFGMVIHFLQHDLIQKLDNYFHIVTLHDKNGGEIFPNTYKHNKLINK